MECSEYSFCLREPIIDLTGLIGPLSYQIDPSITQILFRLAQDFKGSIFPRAQNDDLGLTFPDKFLDILNQEAVSSLTPPVILHMIGKNNDITAILLPVNNHSAKNI